MLKELVQLARDLATSESAELPPTGFYSYKQPIRWVVHLWPDKVYIEETALNIPRPFDRRTLAVCTHPLVDEAAYVLSIDRQPKKKDMRAAQKHRMFCELVIKVREAVCDGALKVAIGWLLST